MRSRVLSQLHKAREHSKEIGQGEKGCDNSKEEREWATTTTHANIFGPIVFKR